MICLVAWHHVLMPSADGHTGSLRAETLVVAAWLEAVMDGLECVMHGFNPPSSYACGFLI
jgi:hypothetical protein